MRRAAARGEWTVLVEFALVFRRLRTGLTRRRVAALVVVMTLVLLTGTLGMHAA